MGITAYISKYISFLVELLYDQRCYQIQIFNALLFVLLCKAFGAKTLLESILVGQCGQPLARLETLENVES